MSSPNSSQSRESMHHCILFGAAERGICLLSGALARSGYSMSATFDWKDSCRDGLTFAIAEEQEWNSIVAGGAAKAICVFDEPGRSVAALLGESPTQFDPEHEGLNASKALDWWCAVHRGILEQLEAGGDWLFLDAGQVEGGDGLTRVGDFLGLPVAQSALYESAQPSVAAVQCTPEAQRIYSQLCALARQTNLAQDGTIPFAPARVTILAYVGPGEEACVPGYLNAAAVQAGVTAELVILDHSGAESLEAPGARVLHCPSPSRAAAWKLGASHSSGEFIAWWLPGCRPLPNQLANATAQLRAKSQVDFVTCTHVLHDEAGEFVERIHPDELPQTPGPCWESGAVMRRSVLEEMASTAFFPVELDLWRKLAQAGRCTHVMHPGFSLNKWIHKARWETTRLDGDLLSQAQLPYDGDVPQLSVSICSRDNRDKLTRCLEGFSRQILPRGSFEIVVVDDGSRDGTFEMLTGLELPVPCRIEHQQHSGLGAARNRSLELARGHLVLFADDSTLPLPDHVGHHIKVHAAQADSGPIAVMGSLKHSRRALDKGLVRHIDGSHADHAPSFILPNEYQAMTSFYECPMSLPAELVRLAGSFDTTYQWSGCEAWDLWVRVEVLGTPLHYQPDAIVLQDNPMSFEDLRKRQYQMARAHVEFFRRNPQVLSAWGLENLNLSTCEASVKSTTLSVPIWEKALASLCSFDIGGLERVGGAQCELANHMLQSLDELLSGLNRVWWHAGYAEGMREAGVRSFADFLRAASAEDPIRSESDRRVFAWPRWDDPECLERMMNWAKPLARDGFSALVLRLDPRRDPVQSVAFANLEAAYARVYADDPAAALEVVVESRSLNSVDLAGLCAAVDGVLALGGEPDSFFEYVSAAPLNSAEQVVDWRHALETGAAPSALVESSAPNVQEPDPTPATDTEFEVPHQRTGSPQELSLAQPAAVSPPARNTELLLSVIVPTHNRPREIVQLVKCLTEQDLDPSLFEVIVVDDGSRQPACQLLGPLRTAFDLQVITQPTSGPGAARNRAMQLAKADMIVFFNDDAVPAADCLRRHLEVQQASDGKHAVLGTFSLLPELVVDSFTTHVESSTALFAQPQMNSGTSYAGSSFCTGNLSISRRALESVGGFDESFRYAGGEDSELGLRLDRQLGIRVLYDATVRCEHDHELRLRGFLKRMRVIGWAAYRIEQKHGNTGLVQGQPKDAAGWAAMRELVEQEETIVSELLESAEDACRREREGGLGALTLESYRDIYDMIAGYGMRCGILAAHEGGLVNLSDEVLAIAA